MQINVVVSTEELQEMKMTARDLEASVLSTLDDHATDQNGARMSYSSFDVHVAVVEGRQSAAPSATPF